MTADDIRLAVPRLSLAFADRDWPAGVRLRGHSPAYWSGRTCGVACLRMVLEHFQRPVPGLFDLLAEGMSLSAYTARGRLHGGLANLGRRHGLQAQAQPAT